jgi:hypothetical protein
MATNNTSKIDAVRYHANDFKVEKNGKKTLRGYSFHFRINGKWTTAAESGDQRAEMFRGIFSADAAAVKLPNAMSTFGIEVPPSVNVAAQEAATRLLKREEQKAKREARTVAAGRPEFMKKKAETAAAQWDKMVERVEKRTAEAETAETDADADENGEAETVAAVA